MGRPTTNGAPESALCVVEARMTPRRRGGWRTTTPIWLLATALLPGCVDGGAAVPIPVDGGTGSADTGGAVSDADVTSPDLGNPECEPGPCCADGHWVPAGGACVEGTSGLQCLESLCDADHVCAQQVKAGACHIGGACVPDGEVSADDACLVCDAAGNQSGWSPAVANDCDGRVCGLSPSGCHDCGTCTVGSTCNAKGQCDDLCAAVDCPDCQTCEGGACVATGDGGACSDDEDACTIDSCKAGECEHTATESDCGDRTCGSSPSGCHECGTCEEGAECTAAGSCFDPCANVDCPECQVCSDGTCGPVEDGGSCTTDENACTGDVCAGGSCTHPAVEDGTFCDDDGDACTADVCAEGACTHKNLGGSCAAVCGDGECGAGEPGTCPEDCQVGPSVPVPCEEQSDCEAVGACPADLPMGCTCGATPEGDEACLPACATDEDCPASPDQTLECSADGTCLPPGEPPNPCGDGTCDDGEEGSCPEDCTGGPVEPVACTIDAECDEPGACPPDASMGCSCAKNPKGMTVCIPSCAIDADCPTNPMEALTCSPEGTCKPGGGTQAVCGDGACAAGEQQSCPKDCQGGGSPECGTVPAGTPCCGDSVCGVPETTQSCPADCP